MRQVGTLAVGLVLALVIAVAAIAADCPKPTDLGDGWTVAAPEQEGLDPALICGIGPRLEALKEAKVHGVVIARHRRLIYEHYFAGEDQRLGTSIGYVNFDAGTMHDVRSISKSVTSLLVGIARDRDLLADLDAPVFSFFPEYDDLRTPEKDRITLRHLLTMSSGLAWDEESVPYTNPSNSIFQMWAARRGDYFVLQQPLAAPPGTAFNYNSGSTDLLGVILHKGLREAARRVCRGNLI
jgi:CubicO group peptidase (beta-lactamase class C family)